MLLGVILVTYRTAQWHYKVWAVVKQDQSEKQGWRETEYGEKSL